MKKGVFVLFIALIAEFFIFSSVVYAIRINEVMPHTNNSFNDEWVELYNEENNTKFLINWKLGDSSSNDTINLTIRPFDFALVVDSNNNYSSKIGCLAFNISNESCFQLTTIGSGLNDDEDKVYLFNNNSESISNFSYNKTIKSLGKSFSFNGSSWFESTPTPGFENYFNITILENSTNTTIITTTHPTTPTTNPPAPKLSIEVEEIEKADAGDEIDVEVLFNNLEDYNYDLKIWIELDGKIVSDTYNEVDKKWKSSNYYLNGVVSHDDDKKTFKLKIDEKISGDAKIIGRIRKTGTSSIINEDSSDIRINKKTISSNSSSSSETQNNNENDSLQILTNKVNTITGESIINLENGEINKDKTYESKTRKILKIVPYMAGILLILIIVFIVLKI